MRSGRLPSQAKLERHSPVQCGIYYKVAFRSPQIRVSLPDTVRSKTKVIVMPSYLPNYLRGGHSWNSGVPHQYVYSLEHQMVQRVPSGVYFHLNQVDTGREEFETLEKGVDPANLFPNFHNFDCGYSSNTANTTSTSNSSEEAGCLPLLNVDITVDFQSSVASTKVTQVFTNISKYVIKEAHYSFPLYDGAAVISFKCHIGEDKLLEGVIKPKEVNLQVTLGTCLFSAYTIRPQEKSSTKQ